MRLAGPDVVLFVTGALLFSGALWGLYAFEGLGTGSTSVYGAFNVQWSDSERTIEVADFGSQGSVDFDFTVEDRNVQTVTVVVACQHAVGVPPAVSTQIAVEVVGPHNLSGTGNGRCGTAVQVPIQASPPPKSGTVQAGTSNEAVETAEAQQLSDAAIGAWSGTLTFQSTGGSASVTPVQYEGSVSAVLKTYAASATPIPR